MWNRASSLVKQETFYCVLSFFLLRVCVFAEEVILDRIEVKINNTVITSYEIDRVLERQRGGIRVSRDEMREKFIVDKLIHEKLEKIGRATTPKGIDLTIENVVLKQNNITKEELVALLAKEGKTLDEYREELGTKNNEENFIAYVIREKLRQIDERTIISESQKRHAGERELSFHLGVILVRFTKETKDTKRKLIEKIKAEVSNDNFSELARKYSESATSDSGGDMGNVRLRDLHEEIRKHIKNLPEGEISEVIEAQNSFYIFRVIGKEVQSAKVKKEIKSISDINEDERQEIIRELQEKEIAGCIESWVREAKDRAYIEVVPEKEST